MGISRQKTASAGFAHLGTLLVLVLVMAVIGSGAYVVYHQNQKKTVTLSSNTASQQSSNAGSTATPTASAPTTPSASISQLTQADSQAETQTVTSGDAQTQQDASSANSAQSNVGGAYDETSF